VKYFLDNCLGPPIAKVLLELDEDVTHLQWEFPRPDTSDEVWIPHLGAKGWTLVTVDHRIRFRPPEAAALRAARIRAFFFFPKFATLHKLKQATHVLVAWPEMKIAVDRSPPGTNFAIDPRGKVKELPWAALNPSMTTSGP
jgi:hypothetical protein